MNDKTKKELIVMMGDVVTDIIVPIVNDAVEGLERKMDQKFDQVESRLDRVEHKLDLVLDEQIVVKGKVADQEKHIKKLETGILS